MSLSGLGVESKRRLAYSRYTPFCRWHPYQYERVSYFLNLWVRIIAYLTGRILALVPEHAKFHNELK